MRMRRTLSSWFSACFVLVGSDQESRRRNPRRRLDHQQVGPTRQGRVLADRASSWRPIEPQHRLAGELRFRAWIFRSRAARTFTSPSLAMRAKSIARAFSTTGKARDFSTFNRIRTIRNEMQSLGFDVDEEKQFAMAVQDVSARVCQADESRASQRSRYRQAHRLSHLPRRFTVHPGDLRAEGLKISDSDKLVAFRIHGVTPEMVRSLHQAGYSPDEDMLIAMRIHGATPEWMRTDEAARLRPR